MIIDSAIVYEYRIRVLVYTAILMSIPNTQRRSRFALSSSPITFLSNSAMSVLRNFLWRIGTRQ